MGLQCGIVGLPNVGKTTLFNCLSNTRATASNFPFSTIKPNVGVISVPDPRLFKLAEIDKPQRVIPATVEFVDISGLARGASKGEGLGNQFLGHIRDTAVIIHVLRCFENEDVTHIDGSINPVRDMETIEFELQIKDLETVESRIQKVEKRAKTGGDKEAAKILELLVKYKATLEQGLSASTVEIDEFEKKLLYDLHLLTNKQVIYVCNVDEKSASSGNKYVEMVKEATAGKNYEIIVIAAEAESEIAELETAEERQVFLSDMGLEEPGVNKLIKKAYSMLQLETFFTTGKDETRAWTVRRGTKAPEAAGVIHSDLQRGFIRAEVIKYNDYVTLGNEAACRDAGKLSVQGKEYVVLDGDILHIRFNV